MLTVPSAPRASPRRSTSFDGSTPSRARISAGWSEARSRLSSQTNRRSVGSRVLHAGEAGISRQRGCEFASFRRVASAPASLRRVVDAYNLDYRKDAASCSSTSIGEACLRHLACSIGELPRGSRGHAHQYRIPRASLEPARKRLVLATLKGSEEFEERELSDSVGVATAGFNARLKHEYSKVATNKTLRLRAIWVEMYGAGVQPPAPTSSRERRFPRPAGSRPLTATSSLSGPRTAIT
jgi:hypothetical protein